VLSNEIKITSSRWFVLRPSPLSSLLTQCPIKDSSRSQQPPQCNISQSDHCITIQDSRNVSRWRNFMFGDNIIVVIRYKLDDKSQLRFSRFEGNLKFSHYNCEGKSDRGASERFIFKFIRTQFAWGKVHRVGFILTLPSRDYEQSRKHE